MRKKQSRSDWLHKDPNIHDWLIETAPQWARDEHGLLIYLAVAEAECNTVTGLKQVHHAATPLPL
ncbi:hypothetical protein LER48_33020, partial [Pseudomonas aeruginosa]|uniref:hypothetical protein n=1 Tax=Pseudomonas aeruginosa TaxID=287 RepID=UPI00389221DB